MILPSTITVSSSFLRVNTLSLSFHHLIQTRLAAQEISEIAMERHPQDEGDSRDHASQGKEACEYDTKKRISDHLILHVLNLYGACAKPSDFEIYAPNASFEDPLMHAHGVNQIKSAFYSLKKVFSESRIVEYSVQEHVISQSKQEIVIDNKQHYKFLGRNIDMVSLIKLYVEDGKVCRHEDWWDKKPLWNRETVRLPLLGRILEMTRRGSMLATHAMMGFGKDPPSQNNS